MPKQTCRITSNVLLIIIKKSIQGCTHKYSILQTRKIIEKYKQNTVKQSTINSTYPTCKASLLNKDARSNSLCTYIHATAIVGPMNFFLLILSHPVLCGRQTEPVFLSSLSNALALKFGKGRDQHTWYCKLNRAFNKEHNSAVQIRLRLLQTEANLHRSAASNGVDTALLKSLLLPGRFARRRRFTRSCILN